MTFRVRVILLIVFIVILGVIINMVKKRQLELKYVLTWLACDIILIVFVCFPQTMGWLANMLGIYSPMNMIFFMGVLMTLCIVFTLTVALSRVTEKVRKLAQIISMLPDEVKKEFYENENIDSRVNK